jgi:hypothetical protein
LPSSPGTRRGGDLGGERLRLEAQVIGDEPVGEQDDPGQRSDQPREGCGPRDRDPMQPQARDGAAGQLMQQAAQRPVAGQRPQKARERTQPAQRGPTATGRAEDQIGTRPVKYAIEARRSGAGHAVAKPTSKAALRT